MLGAEALLGQVFIAPCLRVCERPWWLSGDRDNHAKSGRHWGQLPGHEVLLEVRCLQVNQVKPP